MRTLILRLVPVVAALSPSSAAADPPRRITTNRPEPRVLDLPAEDDAFTFVVFGDRTGGPAEGVAVLRQAVADTNLLDPDLVMTVGDLVEGYTTREPWLRQMTEFRAIMGGLEMPWFPVAGNHDIYWRGDGRPPEEHEADFERHFGPLWYAFEHRRCWFIVLYSDEGNPRTGERNFKDPDCQRMSETQLAWLDATLAAAADARHVFVFLHHPRWLTGRYGEDWTRVHDKLARAGNVTAVFAGHIHQMRYDGRRDGIEYFTLATVGGHLDPSLPRTAGFLHQFHVVTVRDDGIQLACLPVGAALDPRGITGAVNDDVTWLERELDVRVDGGPIAIGTDGGLDGELELLVRNPLRRPIELTVMPVTGDQRFRFAPDHVHVRIDGGARRSLPFRVTRAALPMDENFALPEFRLECDYLGEALRVSLLPRRVEIPFAPPQAAFAERSGADECLELSGGRDALEVDDRLLTLPDGPLTVEGWLNGRSFTGRRAFVTKTENSEFGIFVSDGRPGFSVHLDGAYAEAAGRDVTLQPGSWHHLAGVFDGQEARLYVDGRRVAAVKASGTRTQNPLPLFVGADPGARGAPMSFFVGRIDEVRISRVARYRGASFEAARRLGADEDTILHLTMDAAVGPWVLDASSAAAHARRLGGARLVPREVSPAPGR